MTAGLGPEARALLASARAGLSPDAAAIRRMRTKLGAAVGGGAAGGAIAGGAAAGGAVTRGAAAGGVAAGAAAVSSAAAGGAAGVSAAGVSAAGGALAAKLGLVALAVGLAVAAGWYTQRSPTVAEGPTLERASSSASPRSLAIPAPATPGSMSPQASAAAQTSSVGQASPVTDDALITIDAPSPRPAPRRVLHAVAPIHLESTQVREVVPITAAPGTSSPLAVGLAREVELVDRAMAALRGGDPGAALAAIERHAVETAGHGQLSEDAAAIEIEALCQLRDPAAAHKLAAFDARFPRSAQRTRLSERCPRGP